jgi:hypothetical protein
MALIGQPRRVQELLLALWNASRPRRCLQENSLPLLRLRLQPYNNKNFSHITPRSIAQEKTSTRLPLNHHLSSSNSNRNHDAPRYDDCHCPLGFVAYSMSCPSFDPPENLQLTELPLGFRPGQYH